MTADVGAAAPEFDLESDAGTRVRLADFEGEWLVLYFYPRDNTPGCTREAQDFTQAVARLRKLGAARRRRVEGLGQEPLARSATRSRIGFPLLSDPDLVAHKAYGAWGKKVMYGKQIEGTLRSTFLIAPNGRVAQVWRSVQVDGHADAVVDALIAATTGHAEPAPAGRRQARGQGQRGLVESSAS